MEFVVHTVIFQTLEEFQQGQAEIRPAFSRIAFQILLHTAFDIVADALEQGVEQVFFVFEMPIQRTARYACGLGDFVERSARDTFFVEGVQSGKQ